MTFTAEDIRPAAAAALLVEEAAPAPLPPPKPQAEVEAEFRELLEEKGVRPALSACAAALAVCVLGTYGVHSLLLCGTATGGGRQVTPFSRWERELPKLVTDDRWRAVASMKQRRQLFDAYCKAAADGHKRGKPARGRSAREGFAALLDEAAAPAPPAPGAAPLRPPPVRL